MINIFKEFKDPVWSTKDKISHIRWIIFNLPLIKIKRFLFLAREGCLFGHDWDFIVTEHEGLQLYIEVCNNCNETSGVVHERTRNNGNNR